MTLTIIIISIVIYLYFHKRIVGKVSNENRKLLSSLANNVATLKDRTNAINKKTSIRFHELNCYPEPDELSTYITLMHNKYLVEHKTLMHPYTHEILELYYQKSLKGSTIKDRDYHYLNQPLGETLYSIDEYLEMFIEKEKQTVNFHTLQQ